MNQNILHGKGWGNDLKPKRLGRCVPVRRWHAFTYILMGLAVSPKRGMVMALDEGVTFAVYYNRPIARM